MRSAAGPVVLGICHPPAGEPALHMAAWQAYRRQVPLRLVYAYPPAPPVRRFEPGRNPVDIQTPLLAARRMLSDAAAVARAWYPGLTAVPVLTAGPPSGVLIAESLSAGLVVMGDHPRTGATAIAGAANGGETSTGTATGTSTGNAPGTSTGMGTATGTSTGMGTATGTGTGGHTGRSTPGGRATGTGPGARVPDPIAGDRVGLGAITSRVTARAHSPVLVVRAADAAGEPDAPVIVGVDHSPAAGIALEFGAAEAEARGVPLVALRAWYPLPDGRPGIVGAALGAATAGTEPGRGPAPTPPVDQARQVERALNDHLARCWYHYPGLRVRPAAVRTADPAQALVTASRTAVLLVIGASGGHGPAPRAQIGTDVLARAYCPVAVVRDRRADPPDPR